MNIHFPLKMNIPSLLFTNSNWFYYPSFFFFFFLNDQQPSAVSPASVFTKWKSRLSGSNVSLLMGVFAIIWIICKLSVEVSSSVVSFWPFKPNFGSSGKRRPSSEATSEGCLLKPLQQVFWQSEDIFFVFFFSEKTWIFTKLHICWCQIVFKICVMAAFPAGEYECTLPASEQAGIISVKSCQGIAIQLVQWKKISSKNVEMCFDWTV